MSEKIKTIYISVPMSGRTKKKINRDIDVAVDFIKERYDGDTTALLKPTTIGDTVIRHFCWKEVFNNFAEYKKFANRSDFAYGIYLGFDIMALVEQSTDVLFCEGWKESKGCRLEHAAAEIYGKNIIYL
jgi:hypothetical protein